MTGGFSPEMLVVALILSGFLYGVLALVLVLTLGCSMLLAGRHHPAPLVAAAVWLSCLGPVLRSDWMHSPQGLVLSALLMMALPALVGRLSGYLTGWLDELRV
jgi:hypothetical protein